MGAVYNSKIYGLVGWAASAYTYMYVYVYKILYRGIILSH